MKSLDIALREALWAMLDLQKVLEVELSLRDRSPTLSDVSSASGLSGIYSTIPYTTSLLRRELDKCQP